MDFRLFKKSEKKVVLLTGLILIFTLVFNTSCSADLQSNIKNKISSAIDYIYQNAKAPTVGALGGEWAVMGVFKGENLLEQSDIPKVWYEQYYDNVRSKVKSTKGTLNTDYYTEYERIIMALSTINKDAKSIEGYDLCKYLDSSKNIENQGVNAVAFALIAANMADIKLEKEDEYISYILKELKNNYKNEKSVDYIAICLQALTYYQDRDEVRLFAEELIKKLSNFQNADGDYGNLESTCEVIIALSQWDINAFTDKAFVKSGSLGESLKQYEVGDAFSHSKENLEENQLSTEKALLAMISMKLQEEHKKIYE